MNLYLIHQSKEMGYDTYDSAVVAASTEQAAIEIHPAYWGTDDSMWSSSSWCSDPKYVEVELIGKAKKGTEAGVICASFNAG